MAVIIIVILMGLIYWAMSAGWGLLAMIFFLAVLYIIDNDNAGVSIERFYTGCFFVCIVTGIGVLLTAL